MRAMTIIGGALLLAVFAGAQQADRAEAMLEAAARKERVDGNLKAAVEQYRKIAAQFAKQPEIAARALYQLGQCQERLGEAEARKSYERIVREYGGAQQYASAARARLAAMGGPASGGFRARLLWDRSSDPWGTITADGRWLSIPLWATGDLALRDLVSGETRRVTDRGGYKKSGGETQGTAISPDGKRIAFCWLRYSNPPSGKDWEYELRLIGADGKGAQILLRGKEFQNLQPVSWSPDGKWIVTRARRNNTPSILLVSPDGAPAQTVVSLEFYWEKAILSPDGKWLAFTIAPGIPKSPSLGVLPADGSESRPRELATDANLAGWTPDGRSLLFSRRRDNADHLYLLPFADGRAGGEPRQLQPLPAFFSGPLGVTANGSLILATSRDSADAMVAPIDARTATIGQPSAPQPVLGTDGRLKLSLGPRFSPDGGKISYVTEPKTVLIRSLTDGSERTTLVQLARLERVEWAADGNSLFAGGVNSAGEKGIYRVDLNTGAATLVTASPDPRIMALAPDGVTLYYRNAQSLVARDLKTGAERSVVDPAPALSGHPPDLKVSHDGKKLAAILQSVLRIIDVATGQVQERRARGGDGGYGGVAWSADDRHILVIESNWHKGIRELVSYPMDGGEPARQAIKRFIGLWLSPDGKQVATMRTEWHQQVWALENFLPAAAAQPKK